MNPMMKRLFHTVRDGIFIVGRDGVVRFGNEAALCLIPCRVGVAMPNPALLRMIEAVNGGHVAVPHAADIEIGEDCLVAAADTIRAHLLASPVGTDYVVILHNLTEEHFYASAIANLSGMVERECGANLERFQVGLDALLLSMNAIGERAPGLADEARDAVREGRKLLDTLRRLADLARITGGEPIADDERITVPEWINGCVDLLRPAANVRGMSLLVERPADEMPPVYGSRAWLGRAFGELLDNAVKYGPARSNVLVSFKQNGNFLLISVRNYGDLVPIHLRERLFQVLYRGRNAERKDTPGLGLGLGLARQIVQMHGGNLTLASTEKGTTDFTIELPTGAPTGDAKALDLAQAQRYAQDLARLMNRNKRKSEGAEQ